MNAADVVGYTYVSDVHCPDCAGRAYRGRRLNPGSHGLEGCGLIDAHGLPEYMHDFEGNPVCPVFAGAEGAVEMHCGDCHTALLACRVDARRAGKGGAIMIRARVASWGRWSTAAVRLLRINRHYWVRVRGVGDFCMADLAGAVIFAERMAERYG